MVEVPVVRTGKRVGVMRPDQLLVVSLPVILPSVLKVVVAVPPNSAEFAEKTVLEAFAVVTFPVKVGLAENTAEPVPVSSVSALERFADEGVAKNVAMPVPSPETPVDIGRPVAFVRVPDDGVPSAPPLVTKAPADPTLTPRAVTTPVPGTVIESAPVLPEVVTKPLLVRFERVAMFCEVSTFSAPDVRVSPVPSRSVTKSEPTDRAVVEA